MRKVASSANTRIPMKTVSYLMVLLASTNIAQANSVTTNEKFVLTKTFTLSKNNDTTAKIEWSRANLQKGESYTIVHSTDGKHFESISQFPYDLVEAYDNIIFIHQTPTNGKNSYQLIKNDALGKEIWKSENQSIHFDLPPVMVNLSAHQNELQVQYKLLTTNQVKLSIHDKNGVLRAEFYAKGQKGTNKLHIPNTQLNNDAFMLSIEIPDFKVYRKIPLKVASNKLPRA